MRVAFTFNCMRRPLTEEEAEFDTPQTIAFIREALRARGHEVAEIDVGEAEGRLAERLLAIEPDVVFNTAEGRRGKGREAFFAGLFEELGLAATGPDAHACMVTLDKRLTKLLVAEHGVPTPQAWFVQAGDRLPADVTYPVIVKPNFEGSSKGIHARSVVHEPGALGPCVEELLLRYPEGVLLEQYVEGVDVTVPWVEGARGANGAATGALPPAGYRLPGADEVKEEARRQIYDFEAKHARSEEVSVVIPADLPEPLLQKLQEASEEVARAVGLRDVGRIDWRVTPAGEIQFLEVNALPSFEEGAALHEGWKHLGLGGPEALFDHLVSRAWARRLSRATVTPARTRVGVVHNLRRGDLELDDDDAEFDSPTTIQALGAAVEALGYEAHLIEADARLPARLASGEVDVVLNIAEGRHGRGRESQVPALCELLELPYTGSDPLALGLALDKALAKEVVARAGVRTPRWQLFATGREKLELGLSFPLMVKPTGEGSSKGVHQKSVVQTEAELRERVKETVEAYRQPALVEAFLDGREFTVAIVGDDAAGGARVLAPMEIEFCDKAARFPVYAYAHKVKDTGEVRYRVPADVSPALDEELRRVALLAHRALGCRDVSRVDLRLDATGQPCFLECNPLPGLSPGWSDLCMIAEAEGLSYEELIGAILAPALARAGQGVVGPEQPISAASRRSAVAA